MFDAFGVVRVVHDVLFLMLFVFSRYVVLFSSLLCFLLFTCVRLIVVLRLLCFA